MKSIGIVGCGGIAQVGRVPEYADHRDARLGAFYGLNPERARELAGTYGGRVYETYEELLENGKIDTVSICVPNEFHTKIPIVALKAGKDVLHEKPMAATLGECRQMAEAAEKTGQCPIIGQNQRLTRDHTLTRRLIERGDTGKVITFKTTFGHGGPESWSIDLSNNTWFFDKKRVATGATTDLGIRRTDLIQYLMGEYAAETAAVVTTLDKRDGSGNLIEVGDNTVCIYEMESNAVGTMTANQAYYGQEDNSTILYGSKGIMYIYENSEYCIKVIKPDSEAILYDVGQTQTNGKQTKSGIIDTFMNYIVHGEEVQLSKKSALSAMEAVLASVESTRTGKTIRIG